jgi:hypothetical protein
MKDCIVAINLVPPRGYSYAVSAFTTAGHLELDSPGMTATQTSKYYFAGNPFGAAEARTDTAGPYDDSYVLNQPVAEDALVWSPCSAQRALNAQSRLILQNNEDRTGKGEAEVDAELIFRWDLTWRHC